MRPQTAHRPSGPGPWRHIRRAPLPGTGAFLGAALIGLVSAISPSPASALPFNWSVVPSPNINRAVSSNELNAVSCVSKVGCVAVGDEAGHDPETALIESWNGAKWSVVRSPKPVHRALYGVSCASATACVAVGANFTGAAGDTTGLMESWNGTAWSVMPAAAQTGAKLLGVSCLSPTDCTAVGDKVSAGGGLLTLIESWNGRAWSVVPSPSKGGVSSELSSVSCVSRTVCTAAGRYALLKPKAGSAPLAESWNGTRWSIVPAPNLQDSGSLTAVSCASATACQAVGNYLSGQAASSRALIESWNGTRWSITPTTPRRSELDGVSCVSAVYCWAFGRSWNSAGVTQTFAEFWDGAGWSVESTPNAGRSGNDNNPLAVSCASAGACAAAGNYGGNGPKHTLTLIGTVI